MCTPEKQRPAENVPVHDPDLKDGAAQLCEDAPRAHDDEYDEEWEVWCGGEC